MISRNILMSNLKLSPEKFKQLLQQTQIEDKHDYTEPEATQLKESLMSAQRSRHERSHSPKGFIPNRNGKAPVENSPSDHNGKLPTDEPQISDTATQDANQSVANSLRSTLAGRRGLVEHLASQRTNLTNYVADQVAEILDPVSIDEEIGAKILERLEGHEYASPFELIDLSAELIQIAPPRSLRLSGSGSSPQLATSSG